MFLKSIKADEDELGHKVGAVSRLLRDMDATDKALFTLHGVIFDEVTKGETSIGEPAVVNC